ncbi:MAG: alpha/beta hydrolase [Acetobacteraceae bacterium]|nr:alpha/beta hydrolase [Acetobacteraceae bacterium]
MKARLVLLPGLLADDWSWAHQIRYLADQAEVTVVDLRPYSSRDEMVDRVLAAGPGPFSLAGHSMGGWVAQAVAARVPERLTRLALVCTWGRPIAEFTAAREGTLARAAAGEYETLLEENLPLIVHPDRLADAALVGPLLAMQRKAGRETLLRNMRAYHVDDDSRPLLPLIRCPTLVLAACDDRFFPLAEQQFLASAIAAARLAVIDNCGHSAPMEHPQAVTALLRYWLSYF